MKVVKEGIWEYESSDPIDGVSWTTYRCSCCKDVIDIYSCLDAYDYCPHCGCHMNGVIKNGEFEKWYE